jgi:hypothetical protein
MGVPLLPGTTHGIRPVVLVVCYGPSRPFEEARVSASSRMNDLLLRPGNDSARMSHSFSRGDDPRLVYQKPCVHRGRRMSPVSCCPRGEEAMSSERRTSVRGQSCPHMHESGRRSALHLSLPRRRELRIGLDLDFYVCRKNRPERTPISSCPMCFLIYTVIVCDCAAEDAFFKLSDLRGNSWRTAVRVRRETAGPPNVERRTDERMLESTSARHCRM